jgi:hypothetical protein
VVIFIHFYEMFVFVRPSITLFQMFHVLWWSGKGSDLIGAYDFHIWVKGPITYIAPISSSKWDRLREDWVVVRADVHDHLVLQTESLTAKKSALEETPRLNVTFKLVIERIKHLMSHGLSVMMALHDFLMGRIAPL